MSGVWTHAVLSLADLKPAALDHSAIIAYFLFVLFFINYVFLKVALKVATIFKQQQPQP